MGVGVYESDFNGLGMTFIVDGMPAYLSKEDYHTMAREADEAGEKIARHEVESLWRQESFEDDVIAIVCGATQGLGFVEMRTIGFSQSGAGGFRCSADGDFVLIAETIGQDILQVGWRSWESDYVIGVMPDQRLVDDLDRIDVRDLDEDWSDAQVATGVEAIKDDLKAMADDVSAVIRIHLTRCGVECCYKTSGYTTGRYEPHPEMEGITEERRLTDAINTRMAVFRESSLEELLEQKLKALGHEPAVVEGMAP